MSALTKIFVVLHVVVSLMLAAALIVFVNRQENYKLTAKAADDRAVIANNLAAMRAAETEKVRGQTGAIVVEKDAQISVLQNDVKNREATIATKDGEIARLEADKNQQQASVVSANAALQVAQADLKAQREAYATLQTEHDRTQKQNVESNTRITELTAALDVTTRHDRYMAEQVTGLQTQNTQLLDVLRKYNISPTGNTLPAGGAINPVPAVNINGIVRDFKNINGVPFATISLGSADAVTRGMKFNVIDPVQGRFLGYLIVDTVNAHDATGRLEGPLVTQVRANVSEVRTQL